MKFEIVIDPDCEERVVVYAKALAPIHARLQQLVQEENVLLGYDDGQVVKLNPYDIFYVCVVDSKVWAVCKSSRYLLKERLYQLEEKLPRGFVKINQSCLANLDHAKRFDTSISGTLKIYFQNGDADYVSRRQLKAVKERLGLR